VRKVSLIATVLNEKDSVREWLQMLNAQTRKPDEIVICDGGSTDGTLEELQRLAAAGLAAPLKIITRPGANIAAGRNAAINEATQEIIAVSDAGSRLDPNWLAEITQPFESHPGTSAVAGSYRFQKQTRFQRAAAAYLGRPWESKSFLPSSRSIAFTKEAWQRVGGYPEWLTLAAEDTLFNKSLIDSGIKFVPAPKAIVYWNVRPNVISFLKMISRNAFGDAEAGTGVSAAANTAARIVSQLVFLIVIATYAAVKSRLIVGVAVAAAFAATGLLIKALIRRAPLSSWPHYFLLNALGGAAYLWGYLKGRMFGKQKPRAKS
jgi:cellulose synthase/poly-beta-1,6-N-acetylglucosamine synthase-like glycosyltransferase